MRQRLNWPLKSKLISQKFVQTFSELQNVKFLKTVEKMCENQFVNFIALFPDVYGEGSEPHAQPASFFSHSQSGKSLLVHFELKSQLKKTCVTQVMPLSNFRIDCWFINNFTQENCFPICVWHDAIHIKTNGKSQRTIQITVCVLFSCLTCGGI